MATAPRGSASPQRRAGTTSGATDKAAKRRANDLLRNYYGLSSSNSSASAAANPDVAAGLPSLATVRPVGPPDTGDARDPDSSKFDSALAFKLLLREKGLSQLLADESDLLTEIRELDGERQSLVYNHHHELVAASETIRKMKDRADALTPSLSSLQQSLRDTSTTSKALAIPLDLVGTRSESRSQEKQEGKLNAEEAQRLLAPVVELPHQLRDLILLGEPASRAKPSANEEAGVIVINRDGLAAAERLWGRMEAVLSAWVDAGVPGAKDISAECRAVLREARATAAADGTQ